MDNGGVDLSADFGANGANARTLRRKNHRQAVVATLKAEVLQRSPSFLPLVADKLLRLVNGEYRPRDQLAKAPFKALVFIGGQLRLEHAACRHLGQGIERARSFPSDRGARPLVWCESARRSRRRLCTGLQGGSRGRSSCHCLACR